jgi:hypothetical protein
VLCAFLAYLVSIGKGSYGSNLPVPGRGREGPVIGAELSVREALADRQVLPSLRALPKPNPRSQWLWKASGSTLLRQFRFFAT